MKAIWLAGLAGAATLAAATTAVAAATDPVVPGLEAPGQCEWRRPARKPESRATLYCPGKDGKPAYARTPGGFTADTLARARAGDPDAMNLMGLLHLDAADALRDPAAGKDWLTRAADAGSADGRFNLALALDTGRGGLSTDSAAAAALYRKGAEAGDLQAAVNLGEMLLAGRGVPRDDAEALRLMRAAESRAEARCNIAVMTFDGRGMAADKPAAVALLRKAAEDGSASAAWKLGRAYAAGDGVAADKAEAIRWTRKAGEKSARLAALVLGLTYIIAPGPTAKEAREGDARARLILALELLSGKKMKRDPKAAAGLLASGVEAGIPLAAYKLGELYADGDGLPKDETTALTLLAAGLAHQFENPFEAYRGFRSPPGPAGPPKK